MRAHWIVFALFAPAGVCAQRVAADPELPDSAYLILTLELPIHGTFQVTRIDELGRGRQLRRVVLYDVRYVEVRNCTLSWRSNTSVHQDFRSSRRANFETKVPLKMLDAKSVTVRTAMPGPRARYEPLTYEIVGRARDRRTRPITIRDVESSMTLHRESQFTIPVSEQDAARRLSTVLLDARERCNTWRTAPMPVIR